MTRDLCRRRGTYSPLGYPEGLVVDFWSPCPVGVKSLPVLSGPSVSNHSQRRFHVNRFSLPTEFTKRSGTQTLTLDSVFGLLGPEYPSCRSPQLTLIFRRKSVECNDSKENQILPNVVLSPDNPIDKVPPE